MFATYNSLEPNGPALLMDDGHGYDGTLGMWRLRCPRGSVENLNQEYESFF